MDPLSSIFATPVDFQSITRQGVLSSKSKGTEMEKPENAFPGVLVFKVISNPGYGWFHFSLEKGNFNMKWFRGISLGVLVVLFCSTSGNWSGAAAKEQKKVDVRGEIMNLTPANDAFKTRGGLGSILVIGPRVDDVNNDRAMVRIMKTTKIYKTEKGKKVQAKFEDLKKGLQVEVDFKGPVAESYPVQATAGELRILLTKPN